MTQASNRASRTSLLAIFAVALFACNGADNGEVLGYDQVQGPPTTIPTTGGGGTGGAGSGTSTKPALGDSCHGSVDRCLALKYVVHKDSTGTPIVSQTQALANLTTINSLWKQCGIGFQIDSYIEANPADYNLSVAPASMTELDSIRRAYVDDTTLLVATVGEWSFSANAWTAMPGGSPYGAIMEKSVGTYAPIIAHEIGHYLNLDHAGSQEYLMYYMIYSTSTLISASDCAAANAAIDYFWPKMLR